jgi:hypothetical protein
MIPRTMARQREGSMKVARCVFAIVLASVVVQAQDVDNKVTSTVDKKVDFKNFKTFSWEKGQESHDRTSHKMVVDAVDTELAARGLTRQDSQGDVLVRYHAVGRTHVDLKSDNDGTAPTYDVGRVVVELLGAKPFKQVWQASTYERLSKEPVAREQDVRRAISRLFTAYPKR